MSQMDVILLEAYPHFWDTSVAGNYEMPFEAYVRYWDNNADEMPLYLFDKGFCRTAPQLQADYEVPAYFADDLFSVLGEDLRPDYR